MKNKLITTLAAITLAGFISNANATSITGTVDMGGTVTLNTTALGSASAASLFSAVVVGGTPTGSFTGTGGSPVTWTGFSWPSATLVSPLWTFTSGLTTYSFALANVHAVSQNNFFLNLMGDGTLTATGLDATPGSWSFTVSNSNGSSHPNFKFTFANSQTAAVPDGGTTVLLLGGVLSGLGLIRRKLVS